MSDRTCAIKQKLVGLKKNTYLHLRDPPVLFESLDEDVLDDGPDLSHQVAVEESQVNLEALRGPEPERGLRQEVEVLQRARLQPLDDEGAELVDDVLV